MSEQNASLSARARALLEASERLLADLEALKADLPHSFSIYFRHTETVKIAAEELRGAPPKVRQFATFPCRLYTDLLILRETLETYPSNARPIVERLMSDYLAPPFNRFDECKDSHTGSSLWVHEVELGWFVNYSWGKPTYAKVKTHWCPAHEVTERTHPLT